MKAAILAALRRRALYLALFVLCQIAALIAGLWMLVAALAGSHRAWQLGIGYDQLANVAFGGYPDETISSRAYRRSLVGVRWARWLVKVLDSLEPGHCQAAYEAEILHFQLPPQIRDHGTDTRI